MELQNQNSNAQEINETVQGTETGSAEQQPEQSQPEEKTFKQEDVNNIVARESKKAQEKMLRDLGLEDFESAKDGLAKLKEWQESQKTEAQRQAEQIATAEAEKKAASERAAQLEAKLTAVSKGVDPQYLEEVILLAQAQVKDDVTIDQAIDQVVEKFPTFTGKAAETQKPEKKPQFSSGTSKVGTDPVDVWESIRAKYKK